MRTPCRKRRPAATKVCRKRTDTKPAFRRYAAYDQALGGLLEIVAGRCARLVTLAPDMVDTVLSPIWAEAGWQ